MRRPLWLLLGVLALGVGLAVALPDLTRWLRPGPTGPDLSAPTVVFDQTMAAVAGPKLDALWPLLTAEARSRFEQDLRAFQVRLRDPQDGPRIAADVLRRRPATRPAEFEAARDGPIDAVWAYFLAAKPRPPKPKRSGPRFEPDGRKAEIAYEDAQGTQRVVLLRRTERGWQVDYLPL
jgi:hypothetical protein